jgi:hypothetical protein
MPTLFVRDDPWHLNTRCILQYVVGPDHKAFVYDVLKQDGALLEYVPIWIRIPKHVVLAAVSNCGTALNFAPPKFKDDKQVVLAAISSDPFALSYASPTLKRDPEVRFPQRLASAPCHTVRAR